MKQHSFHPQASDQPGQEYPPLYLAELSPPRKIGPLEWWYRLTAPPDPPPSANFRRHEAARRGRLISLLLLLMIIIVFVVLPIALFSGNYPLLIILFIGLGTQCLTLALNRRGHVLVAGLIIVGVTMIGYVLAQTFNPGGLRVGDLPDFDLLVWVELLAVSLLPARSVFVVAALDSFFIWADVSFQPHAPDLVHFLSTDGYAAIGRPITIQIVVAVVAYLWVRSATAAIARADRAEVIAALEHAMAAQQRASRQQTLELEESIAQLVETHQRVSAGDFRARVHLQEEDVLAPVADSLNLLLVRFQRLLAESEELERTKVQSARVVASLREAVVTGKLPRLPEQGAGTTVDLIILELLPYLSKNASCPLVDSPSSSNGATPAPVRAKEETKAPAAEA